MPDSGLGGVSPDGRLLAFVARRPGALRTIWVRALDGQESRPLPGSEGASQPFWSPDSRELAFFADSKLRVITMGGGRKQFQVLVDPHKLRAFDVTLAEVEAALS